ncbi:MAG TPA: nickel-dependent hydrogenase large subunit [Coriobacteriia bacterium]|nr:nickel-dependent hydrogenase large subunit [Coriobacteriia bacterium]
MGQTINIDVHHITRVEGHGNIKVNVTDGLVETCEWSVPEAPRFFEAMVRGRHYTEVARIVSRICGICAVGHTLAACKAVEDAMGIEITEQTRKLRTLLKHAENADSHILHVYVLVAPDLLGAQSAFALVPTHGEVVARALRLKRLTHEWGSLIGGRTTHPTTVVPGGFTRLPSVNDLVALREKILAAVPDLEITVDTVASLAGAIPDFDRPTEYMAVTSDDEYGLYDGYVQTILPDGDRATYAVADYRSCTNEYVSPNSTAKYAKNRLDSYAAGALARFNVNYDKLHPEAKAVAERLGMGPICTNPYFNSVAQVVEIVHSVYEGLRLIDELIAEGVNAEALVQPTSFGRGTAVIEVPRGILFHEYAFDEEGFCTDGNCIIPTGQNHANIQADFDALLPWALERAMSEDEMRLTFEMLVRAYDPCISCSTHYLDVEFVR